MSETEYVRARSPEQKAERRASILSAAADILDESGIDAASLSAIAERAALSKSNLYRYFESREEILMWLLAAELEAAVTEIGAGLMPPGPDPLAQTARAIAAALARRPRLCLLMSRMSSTLEQNMGEERIVSFKLRVMAEIGRAAAMLHAVAPALPQPACIRAALHVHTLVSGLWPSSHPPPVVARVLEREEFRAFRRDFAATLEADMLTFLRGLSAQEGP